MRQHVLDFVAEAAQAFDLEGPVVEIGSRPADGEAPDHVRQLFAGREFTGCDLQAGPGVDQIEDIHRLSFEDDSLAMVVSIDTLEHVADPIRALEEIHRVLKPGGVAVIASVMFFPIHAHPWDYWRFTPEGFLKLLDPFESAKVFALGWQLMPESVLGVGVKGQAEISDASFPLTAERCATWGDDLPVDFGPIRMTVRDLWKRAVKETFAAARTRLRSSS